MEEKIRTNKSSIVEVSFHGGLTQDNQQQVTRLINWNSVEFCDVYNQEQSSSSTTSSGRTTTAKSSSSGSSQHEGQTGHLEIQFQSGSRMNMANVNIQQFLLSLENTLGYQQQHQRTLGASGGSYNKSE